MQDSHITSHGPIAHDMNSGSVKDATPLECLGMMALKQAAWMTKPLAYVGFSKAASLVKTFLPSKRSVQTLLYEDTLFEYPYADGYWSRLAYDTYDKCEEDFLLALRDVDYAYIDCGANYGYMSALVTSNAFGNKPAIAIEADPDTFATLAKNANNNNNRFEIRNNAVFSRSGEMVNIHGHKHEARSILDDNGNRESGSVETLALEDLSGWVKKQGAKALILKLDVEGVEIDAIKGAGKLLNENLLISYEDHGNDKSSEISRYMMETLGMRVFMSRGSGCKELKTLDEINAIKVNSRVGYDFLATGSGFWTGIISNLKYTSQT